MVIAGDEMSARNRVYRVSQDGIVSGLHSDDLLSGLGEQDIVRASNVEFDNVAKKWSIELVATGERLPQAFARREEAVAQEVVYLNNRISAGDGV
jgi:hypothetical protein